VALNGKRIRYAVVGVGNISQVAALPAFGHASENSELVALVSSDREKLAKLADRYAIEVIGSYDELEDVCKRGRVDAIYLATPNSTHREFVERAARVGVNVLCEKPMALSVAECESMARTCDDHRVKLMIAYRLHFEEANMSAVEILQSGGIGTARAFSSVFCQQVRPGDIRTRRDLGGGALYDVGIYCINAARYLFRDEPVEVFGYQTFDLERFREVDQSTFATLRFSDDQIAQFACSLGLADVSSYRVVGSDGDLVLEPAYDYATDLKRTLTVSGRSTSTIYGRRDQFAPEIIHFSDCILDDEEPSPSAEEGIADVRVLEAIVASAKHGQAVGLEPMRRRRYPGIHLHRVVPPVEKLETFHAPPPTIH
jgi:predicted dehydrogenase